MEIKVNWDPAKYVQFGDYRDRPFLTSPDGSKPGRRTRWWTWAVVLGTSQPRSPDGGRKRGSSGSIRPRRCWPWLPSRLGISRA